MRITMKKIFFQWRISRRKLSLVFYTLGLIIGTACLRYFVEPQNSLVLGEFGWEDKIPFIPWMIYIYNSIFPILIIPTIIWLYKKIDKESFYFYLFQFSFLNTIYLFIMIFIPNHMQDKKFVPIENEEGKIWWLTYWFVEVTKKYISNNAWISLPSGHVICAIFFSSILIRSLIKMYSFSLKRNLFILVVIFYSFLIIVSVLVLKEHTVMDVISASVLVFIVFLFTSGFFYFKCTK